MSDNKIADLRAAAKDAWLWGLPLIECAEQRSARAKEQVRVNTYQHQRKLMDSGESFVTTPNNDTLYSQAWVCLDHGPVTLTIPPTGERYFSLALMDMYTNNFAIFGPRTLGDDGGTFTLVGPQAAAAMAPNVIRAPTPWVWVLGRTLVDGEHDLAAACAVQDGLRIDAPQAGYQVTDHAERNAPWGAYFASVQALMNESPPPATDMAALRRMEPLIAFGRTFDASRFSKDEVDAIKAGVADARQAIADFRRGVPAVNGWVASGIDLGVYHQNYIQRAATALGGLAALPRQEAMYFSSRGPDGVSGYDSAKRWKLTFPASKPLPIESFWSLSMYRKTSEGQLYFADNPINRFAIGDRTPGLKRDADGSLTIWLSRADPGGDRSSNWLPSPKDENFVLALRAYIPRTDMLNGKYQVPQVEEV